MTKENEYQKLKESVEKIVEDLESKKKKGDKFLHNYCKKKDGIFVCNSVDYVAPGYTYNPKEVDQTNLKWLLEILEEGKRKHVDNPNHPDLASIYNNIGVIYALLGDHKKELEYCEKALEICKIIYADNLNENLSISYHNVGIAYEKIGEYQKALDYKLKSLEISEIIYISQCKFLMLTLLLIDRFDYIEYGCGKLSNPQKELEYCLEELKRQKEIANRDNRTNLYICYNRVGISYYKLGDYQNALEYFFKNLEIAQNMIADSQNSSAPKDVDDMVYNNIGATYKEMGKYDEALEYLLKALEIRKTLYKDKPYDEVMIKNITRIAECYEALGNEEKAKEYYSLIKK